MIQIGGLIPFTTIDYPGKLAAVLFLTGCPMRCKYCSNPHLLELRDGEYDPDKIIDFLKLRTGKLEAVVFSGGEALMQNAATTDFMRRVRDMGFAIGLHTNGFYPDVLAAALDIIDWVGLDFKAISKNYEQLCGSGVAYERMIKTLDILLLNNKDFEVRVTCDPRFVDKSDLLEIANFCAGRGVKNFAVQRYIPHFNDDTEAFMRDQFFNDGALRDKIDSLFSSVVWRE